MKISLDEAKAEEWSKVFPDGVVPVVSDDLYWDPDRRVYYYAIDTNSFTEEQRKLFLQHARKKVPPEITDGMILGDARLEVQDTTARWLSS